MTTQPYCLNYLVRNAGEVYFRPAHKDFKTIGDALRFIKGLKNSMEKTTDRYLYKRSGRRGFSFINEY
jgi:hypothetical protein